MSLDAQRIYGAAEVRDAMRATAMFLRFDIGLPFRKVVGAATGLDSIRFTPAAVLGFEKRAADNASLLAGDVVTVEKIGHRDGFYGE